VAAALTDQTSLALTAEEVGASATAYIAGAVLGALLFGHLTDKFGRKRLFTATLCVYMAGTALTGLSWDFWSFALFRFITGAGIGGEYAAINSAIQELVPARHRGRTDLIVNGSFWLGAAFGAAGSTVLLDPALWSIDTGWRLSFVIGAALAVIVVFLRRHLPESPRWLMVHGRIAEAERIVADIERSIERHRPITKKPEYEIRIMAGHTTTLFTVLGTILRTYRRRAVLCIVLMASQAFLYNAIFFTYALVLQTFYGVRPEDIGWYIFPFAIGNFLGPLLLGHWFDTIGRRTMIAATYALSGILLAGTAFLFLHESLDAAEQTMAWTTIFFFASAAASAAYLTAGEAFPLEIRANAIALFYAFGTGLGGMGGPWLFGLLIGTGARENVFWAYLLAAALMAGAAATAAFLGFDAERRALEHVAHPLSLADAPSSDATAPRSRRRP
jgi:MFS family permease